MAVTTNTDKYTITTTDGTYELRLDAPTISINNDITATGIATNYNIDGVYTDNTLNNWTTTPYNSNLYYDTEIGKLYTYVTTNTTTNIYNEIEKENAMNSDFNFGPYTTKDIKLSLYGMAVRRSDNKWVAYDKNTGSLIDVDIFNLSIASEKVFYKLPKATKEVMPGDIILHNNKPMFVENVREDGKFEVINPAEGTAVTILPLKSPFGFDFTTVIINIADYLPQADSNNPFGSLLPLILSGDSNTLIFALMGNKNFKDIDPMLLFALGNTNNMSALLLMQMM